MKQNYFEKNFFQNNSTSFIKILFNCFLIFNLWIVFRINDVNDLINYLVIFYSDIFSSINFANIILLFTVIFAIYLQKYDNFYYLKSFVKKINLISTFFFFLIIVLTGLAINTGQSEKFIYFQF